MKSDCFARTYERSDGVTDLPTFHFEFGLAEGTALFVSLAAVSIKF